LPVFAIFNDEPNDLPPKLIRLGGAVIAANLLAWAWAVTIFHGYPLLIATAFIAYGFGLRHAVDADHIAAIDNVIRKLMQGGKRPISAGFFFSLGHSTLVFAASLLIASTVGGLQRRFPGLLEVGGIVGTLVSALFLFAIATINMFVLTDVFRLYRRMRRGGLYADEELNNLLARRGLLGRLLRHSVRLMSQSWHMYPLGFLFGLGFDTATEIGLLGISAAEASKGLSIWAILVFPTLFAAGMSLIDTGDGVLMVGTYGWAFVNPIRKLWYNLTITSISVIVAILVGTIEALGLVKEKLGLIVGVSSTTDIATDHFAVLGYLIVGSFAASWLVSFAIYRAMGYHKIDPI
jgi:nickel/cobalt transporter (NiCoT) family protein